MSESSLSKSRLASQRQALVDTLDSMRLELQQVQEQLRDKGADPTEQDEPLGPAQEWEMVLARERILEARIDDYEQALARVENGTYGLCQECGQPIPWERLQVVPEARRCVRCQALYEEDR